MVTKSKNAGDNGGKKKPAVITANKNGGTTSKKKTEKKSVSKKAPPLYQKISQEKQFELFQHYGGDHPLGLINEIARSLRLKQAPTYGAAFALHATEHGVTRADWSVVKSLIGAILSRRKRFSSKVPKRESFYDFQGAVARMRNDKEAEARYQVQEKFGSVMCFVRGRDDQPILTSAWGNPSKHMLRAAAMFAYDHWIAHAMAEEISGPTSDDLYREHVASINRCFNPGESPIETGID